MRRLYSLLLTAALPFVFFRLYLKGRKNPLYRQRWKERLGILPQFEEKEQTTLWIHAVSVGEVEATQPLVKKLSAELPELTIVITTTTPTGAETVRRRYGDQIRHYYLPYDLVSFQQRFFDRIDPDLVIIMETELWPNLIHVSQTNHVPVMLANARMAKRSARGYRRMGSLARSMFKSLAGVAAQTQSDADRMIMLGTDPNRVIVSGSLKFDQEIPSDVEDSAKELREQIGQERAVWIAASTHAGEEEQVLEAHRKILKAIPGALLILVPRHPERFDEVYELCSRSGFSTSRRGLGHLPKGEIYLVDTMGDLLMCYGAADVAFVAGSLMPIGGHNLLEPANFGLPILMGMHTFKIEKIFDTFLNAEAAFRVSGATDLANCVLDLFSDETKRIMVGNRARKLLDKHRGAAQCHFEMVKRLLT